ncbi:uncharacterized protein UHO2_00164 [Ustilago hordei]|uniref:uncharacterized protein n=1 Tax=Ustilago hordei TaxID=120017 RepID=UPI001A5F716A|nr:uncharacterized protein UHO2_00164 [Ustilago hordei]SYW81641.1 uncharacterized protein UHO2_00164 [Ustilago hordei]
MAGEGDHQAEEGSDSDDDNECWSTLIKATLRVVPHAIQHLEGTYDNNHPKWDRNFDDALAETSLLGAPFSDDAIYTALQRCTIWHPVYKETVATVHQASAQAAGSNEQDSDTDEDAESSKAKTGPRRIHCWVCRCYGHGARKCDATVTIPENSPLTQTK